MNREFILIFALVSLCLVSGCGDDSVEQDAQLLIIIAPEQFWAQVPENDVRRFIADEDDISGFPIGFDNNEASKTYLRRQTGHGLVPVFQVEVISAPGLPLGENALQLVQQRLEANYSARLGGAFRMFTLEETDIGNTRGFRMTGNYKWRTNNIRVMQYLIPGNNRFYSMTYTANERIFPRYLEEAETMAASLYIDDAPIYLGFFGTLINWLVLAVIIAAVAWGLYHAIGLAPAGTGSSFSLRRLILPKGPGSKNPFQK